MSVARWDGGEPQFLDQAGQPEAAAFVWRKLRAHDLGRLEWFKLLPLSGHHLLRGLCRYPLRAAPRSSELWQGYRITASANVLPSFYPHRYALAIGSVTREAPARSRRRPAWSYVLEDVTFRDAAETLVFVAGHEAFHFLRHSCQVPGRNTEPGANRYGLGWLEGWRSECAREVAMRGRRRWSAAAQLGLPFF
ncbi:MAG TPA: hypothetical protein VNB06_22890 [Thermoanaerobaculia bacterium]|nr:hypothetical protein [Thermoanaerobaculia bacterium]